MTDLSKPAEDPRPKVLIATPHAGSLHWVCHESIMGLVFNTKSARVLRQQNGMTQPMHKGCRGSNIAENQNELVTAAEDLGADYILFIETDHAFPPQTLDFLLMHGKDIIGCTYPYKDHDLLARLLAGQPAMLRFMANELDTSAITFKNLIELPPIRMVEFVPMGCTLISMKAINQVRDYRTKVCQPPLPEGVRACAFRHAEAYIPNYNKTRTVATTTDSTFCSDARQAGLDIWLDGRLSLFIEHIGETNYGMLPEAWAPPELLGKSAA